MGAAVTAYYRAGPHGAKAHVFKAGRRAWCGLLTLGPALGPQSEDVCKRCVEAVRAAERRENERWRKASQGLQREARK